MHSKDTVDNVYRNQEIKLFQAIHQETAFGSIFFYLQILHTFSSQLIIPCVFD